MYSLLHLLEYCSIVCCLHKAIFTETCYINVLILCFSIYKRSALLNLPRSHPPGVTYMCKLCNRQGSVEAVVTLRKKVSESINRDSEQRLSNMRTEEGRVIYVCTDVSGAIQNISTKSTPPPPTIISLLL